MIRDPYVAIGVVVVVMFVLMALVKIPNAAARGKKVTWRVTLRHLWRNREYRFGVVAQMFYVAAQIMVWTFIIQYADYLGIDKATAQTYNIGAMCMHLFGRFAGTFIMRYIRASRLLTIFGVCAGACTIGAIVIVGMPGLYCLMGISLFMSIMFLSIYGIALERVDAEDTSLGAAFLVMAIVGGALMPPLQGAVIDLGTVGNLPAVNVSFALPLLCFVIVTAYGRYTSCLR